MNAYKTAINKARTIPWQKGRHRLAAVALDANGNILSVGVNSYTKTHPLQKKYDEMAGSRNRIYLHAEIDAIVKAKAPIYEIVIVRINKNGDPVLAKPCRVCRLAITHAGIKHIHHS